MNDDDLLKDYKIKENALQKSLEEQTLWREAIKRDTRVSDLTIDYISLGELTEKPLNDFAEKNIGSLMNLSHVPFDYKKAIESQDKTKKEKEAEELRRHNEQISVGKEQVELLKEQIQKLSLLLHNSQKSNEQRDAIIHFMVRMMIQMEASQKEKKKTLSGILMQISSITALGADVSGIYEFVENELKKLAKEE